MKSDILFLAPYPTPENIKDGMVSRVNAIDSFFKDINRIYLRVSLSKNRKKKFFVDGKASVYELNAFIHIFLILRILFSCKKIYSHSIWGCWGIWPFLLFFRKAFILDAHGVVPEEIQLYYGKKLLGFVLNIIECVVFKKAKVVICVTENMRKHFQQKHPHYKGKYLVYCIYPDSIKNIHIDTMREEKNSGTYINVLYSGGIAPWQNIDLMLDVIKDTLAVNVKYTLLVSDKDYVENLIKLKHIESNNIVVKSVLPEELYTYYAKADYAFILRDDNVVNHVANPTKLVEYMRFGIIPIVLSENIGDFSELGYEYVYIDEYKSNLIKPLISQVNVKLINQILARNEEIDIKNVVLGLS